MISLLIICSILLLSPTYCGKVVHVSNVSQLHSALSSVQAGDTIQLADGNYHGSFVASKSGTKDSKITMIGSASAVLSNTGYGFNLKGNYWILKVS